MAPMKSPVRHSFGGLSEGSFSLTHMSRRWNISRRQLRHLLQTRQLPFIQVRGQFRVPCSAVFEFERQQALESSERTLQNRQG